LTTLFTYRAAVVTDRNVAGSCREAPFHDRKVAFIRRGVAVHEVKGAFPTS
jgi:hypothetical protein